MRYIVGIALLLISSHSPTYHGRQTQVRYKSWYLVDIKTSDYRVVKHKTWASDHELGITHMDALSKETNPRAKVLIGNAHYLKDGATQPSSFSGREWSLDKALAMDKAVETEDHQGLLRARAKLDTLQELAAIGEILRKSDRDSEVYNGPYFSALHDEHISTIKDCPITLRIISRRDRGAGTLVTAIITGTYEFHMGGSSGAVSCSVDGMVESYSSADESGARLTAMFKAHGDLLLDDEKAVARKMTADWRLYDECEYVSRDSRSTSEKKPK